MSTSRQSVPSTLVAVAAVMVLLGTLGFSSLQPSYSHITNTISELGETGAVHPHLVAYGFFLPVGLMVWLALWLLHREADGKELSRVLLALSCLGTGYVASASFSCAFCYREEGRPTSGLHWTPGRASLYNPDISRPAPARPGVGRAP
jgi:hypothetical protein